MMPRRPGAHVAEALDGEGRLGRGELQVRRGLPEHEHHAAARGRLPPVGALERDRLAGHARGRVSVQLAVLVHEPGHHLGVGAHVGSRDVPRRSEHLLDLVHERARDRLELALLELVRIHVDPALGAPVGDAGDRGLPGHQGGERAHLVEVDLGVEADASLVGAARAVVLDAVAGEDVDLPVAELDGHLNLHLAVGRAEHRRDVVAEPEPVRGPVEPVRDDLVVRDLRPPRAGVGLGRSRRPVGARGVRHRISPGSTAQAVVLLVEADVGRAHPSRVEHGWPTLTRKRRGVGRVRRGVEPAAVAAGTPTTRSSQRPKSRRASGRVVSAFVSTSCTRRVSAPGPRIASRLSA